MIPKLEMPIAIEKLKMLQEKSGLEEATNILYQEQNQNFVTQLLLVTMQNPDAVRGFIVCYLTIREMMLKQSECELERMFRL